MTKKNATKAPATESRIKPADWLARFCKASKQSPVVVLNIAKTTGPLGELVRGAMKAEGLNPADLTNSEVAEAKKRLPSGYSGRSHGGDGAQAMPSAPKNRAPAVPATPKTPRTSAKPSKGPQNGTQERQTFHGHSVTGTTRWMGRNGWTRGDAVKVWENLADDKGRPFVVPYKTIDGSIHQGSRVPTSSVPALTKAHIKELTAAKNK